MRLGLQVQLGGVEFRISDKLQNMSTIMDWGLYAVTAVALSTLLLRSPVYVVNTLNIVLELSRGRALLCGTFEAHCRVVCDHFGKNVEDRLGGVSCGSGKSLSRIIPLAPSYHRFGRALQRWGRPSGRGRSKAQLPGLMILRRKLASDLSHRSSQKINSGDQLV